jgi:phosphoribosylglycinamide formyltransferase-1
MRLLSLGFVQGWHGRMLNIHPSLLPEFKGRHPQRQALEAGVAISGCTVHYVTPEMDAGPVVAREEVPVLPGDDEASLSARILAAEHRLYPRALKLVATTIAGRAG